jgi:hypothetical protein
VRKGRLNGATLAARWLRGESVPKQPQPVPAAAWLFEKGLRPDSRVWETAIGMPAYNAVLSLLLLRESITSG